MISKVIGHVKQVYEVTTVSQTFCLAAIVILSMYFPVIMHSSDTYTRNRKLERPDYDHEHLIDFWMVIPISIVLRFARILIRKSLDEYFKKRLSVKFTGEDLEKKIFKSCKGVFKVLYFSITSTVGYLVLRETNFASWLMFCGGDSDLIAGNWPFIKMPSLMKFHYMLCLSYYVEDGVAHMIQTPNYDYWEMTLHHMIAAMLIFASYMNGFWNFGVLVLVQMDF